MSIDREDGPIKHYRMRCDSCGKQTKRFAYGFEFSHDAPPGWRDDDEHDDGWDPKHYCPACEGVKKSSSEEVIPNAGDYLDISDHEAVLRPMLRKDNNTIIIDCMDGTKLIISSESHIKIERIQE